MIKIALFFLFSLFSFPLTLAAEGNFQKCKEKEAHIQESTTLKNKLSLKHIFQQGLHFISHIISYQMKPVVDCKDRSSLKEADDRFFFKLAQTSLVVTISISRRKITPTTFPAGGLTTKSWVLPRFNGF